MDVEEAVTLSRGEVYEKYADNLVRFATGLVGPSDSQDVVATAVMRAMWSRQWPAVHNQRAYLYKAVLNEARMHHRGAIRRRARELRALDPISVAPPEIRPEVLEAVERLNFRQRAVVFLTYWEDLPGPEIAHRLGLSESSVHRYLRHAEARLRGILDD
jgi:RNA polymerase sigma factor (sigma-70 family)